MGKQVFRLISIVAGVLTVAVILLSQSLHLPEIRKTSLKEKHKTEQTRDRVVLAPVDVVTSPLVQLDEVFPVSLDVPVIELPEAQSLYSTIQLVVPYFNILFRSIISPNAP
jgi:hypothetical protein